MDIEYESVICALPISTTPPLSSITTALPLSLPLSTTVQGSHSLSVPSHSLPSSLPLSTTVQVSHSLSVPSHSLPSSLPLSSPHTSAPLIVPLSPISSTSAVETSLPPSLPPSLPYSLPVSKTTDDGEISGNAVLNMLESDPSSSFVMDVAANNNLENTILENNSKNNDENDNENDNDKKSDHDDISNGGDTEKTANQSINKENILESAVMNVENSESTDPGSASLLSLSERNEKKENREIDTMEKTEMEIENTIEEKTEITKLEEKPLSSVSCIEAVHTLQVKEMTETLISAPSSSSDKEVESSVPLFSIEVPPTEDMTLPLCPQSTTLNSISSTEKTNPYSVFHVDNNSPNGYRTPRYVRTTMMTYLGNLMKHHVCVSCCFFSYTSYALSYFFEVNKL